MNKPRLILISAIAAVAACTGPGPIVGGPCSYEDTQFTTTPAGYSQTGVQFTSPEGDPFEIESTDFKVFPVTGTEVSIRRQTIIEGTCTPVIYTVVEGEG